VNSSGESPFWSIAVEYLGTATSRAGKSTNIDYREVLNDVDCELFQRIDAAAY
jgi:hypothetical protein